MRGRGRNEGRKVQGTGEMEVEGKVMWLRINQSYP